MCYFRGFSIAFKAAVLAVLFASCGSGKPMTLGSASDTDKLDLIHRLVPGSGLEVARAFAPDLEFVTRNRDWEAETELFGLPATFEVRESSGTVYGWSFRVSHLAPAKCDSLITQVEAWYSDTLGPPSASDGNDVEYFVKDRRWQLRGEIEALANGFYWPGGAADFTVGIQVAPRLTVPPPTPPK